MWNIFSIYAYENTYTFTYTWNVVRYIHFGRDALLKVALHQPDNSRHSYIYLKGFAPMPPAPYGLEMRLRSSEGARCIGELRLLLYCRNPASLSLSLYLYAPCFLPLAASPVHSGWVPASYSGFRCLGGKNFDQQLMIVSLPRKQPSTSSSRF